MAPHKLDLTHAAATSWRAARRLRPSPGLLLGLILLVSLGLRLLWLDHPDDELIFDELYYVNAARVIAGLPAQHYQRSRPGWDPNTQHPPLAKVIVAGSIALLGDNAYAWRLPSVAFGTISIFLLYLIARRVGASPGLGLLASFLFAFDNLAFVHGRIFTLDIFALGFMLLATLLYLRGRVGAAGLALALAALCKLTGAAGLLALIAFELLGGQRDAATAGWRPKLQRLGRLVTTFGLTFLALLALLDWRWVGYRSPFDHLAWMATYNSALRTEALRGPDVEVASMPWQWLINERQIHYYAYRQTTVRATALPNETAQHSSAVTLTTGPADVLHSQLTILFVGALNPFLLPLLPLGLGFACLRWRRNTRDRALAALALAWAAANYLPYLGIALLSHRVSYIYYMLALVPGIALSGAWFLREAPLPRGTSWLFAAAILVGFAIHFPFKAIP